MKKYELMYIVSTKLSDESREELINKISSIITSCGSEDLAVEKIGSKKLAYTINYMNEGFYVLNNFSANSEVNDKLNAFFKIQENILRFMCIAK